MKFWLGVTDTGWFRFLRSRKPYEVNFWQPSGNTTFKAIPPGSPFLFKTKAPYNSIGGVGFFVRHTFLPVSMAWDVFREENGVPSHEDLSRAIVKYREKLEAHIRDPVIGCIVLTDPIFFADEDMVEVPPSWQRNIVVGKTYDSGTAEGQELWQRVARVMEKYSFFDRTEGKDNQLILDAGEAPERREVLTHVRMGQGAFRVMLTDAYERRCAVTGERILPILEAAHIKPYAKSGPHLISNGLLLRSDLHKLFDQGYMTVAEDGGRYRVEISQRLKTEFDNGKEYYKLQGKELFSLPALSRDRPSPLFLEHHNHEIFR